MFAEPRDDWYEWNTAHDPGANAAAGWLLMAAIIVLLLLAPWV